MTAAFAEDNVVRRLPVPLARLALRTANAKTETDLWNEAWRTWEAGLKTLAAVAVVAYQAVPTPDPALDALIQKLAQPALGDWIGLLRSLVPVLADRGHPGFAAVRETVFGSRHGDLPRAAGLAGLLDKLKVQGDRAVELDVLLGKPEFERPTARAKVSVAELFNQCVWYRNAYIGHGLGHRHPAVRDRVGRTLQAGFADVFAAVEPLVDHALVHLDDVRRDGPGWAVGGIDLSGPDPVRFHGARWPNGPDPIAGRAYLRTSDGVYLPAHPLFRYDPDAEQMYILNARRGRTRVEYLCYVTGHRDEREESPIGHRDLLTVVLGIPTATGRADPSPPTATAVDPRYWTAGKPISAPRSTYRTLRPWAKPFAGVLLVALIAVVWRLVHKPIEPIPPATKHTTHVYRTQSLSDGMNWLAQQVSADVRARELVLDVFNVTFSVKGELSEIESNLGRKFIKMLPDDGFLHSHQTKDQLFVTCWTGPQDTNHSRLDAELVLAFMDANRTPQKLHPHSFLISRDMMENDLEVMRREIESIKPERLRPKPPDDRVKVTNTDVNDSLSKFVDLLRNATYRGRPK